MTLTDHNSEHAACVAYLTGSNDLQNIRKTDLAFGIVLALLCSDSLCLFSSSSILALLSCTHHDLFTSAFIVIKSVCVSPHPFSLSDYVRECIVGTGQSYRGRRSVTVSGILCQAWASPIPHEHKYESDVFFVFLPNVRKN